MKKAWFVFAMTMSCCVWVWADEMVLTTYYPAPNGQYLNMNVSGTLTGNAILMTGGVTGAALTASSLNPSISLVRNGTTNFLVNSNGNTVISGTLAAGSTTINGSLSATGKIYSGVSTVGGDLSSTLTTKDYVDGKKPLVDYGACYEINTCWDASGGTTYCDCAANYVVVGLIAHRIRYGIAGSVFDVHSYGSRCCKLRN